MMKQGVDDFLAAGGTIDDLRELPEVEQEKPNERNIDYVGLMKREMEVDGSTLWHDHSGDGYATIPQQDGQRNVRTTSDSFKTYLHRIFYRATGKGPKSNSISDAVGTFTAIAQFDLASQKYETALRWFHQRDANGSVLWIDLCDGTGCVLKISAMTSDDQVQHEIVQLHNSPVRFVQPSSMRALPRPIVEGPMPDIREFVNISAGDVTLLWGFMVGCFTPYGGLPFLMMTAQQGSGKSMACRFIRSLIDPSIATSRTASNLDDIRSGVSTNALLVFDNLSGISTEMSNFFCQLSSGAGFSKKRLYTDYEESLVSGKRPVIFNGLSEVAHKPDLQSRCISIELPVLTGKIRSEQELELKWDQTKPRMFGELVTRLSRALRDLSTVNLEDMPRLADMVKWVTASEPDMEEFQFVAAFNESSGTANQRILDEDPVARAIIKLATLGLPARISTAQLLELLLASNEGRTPRGFPDNAKKLGNKLRELAPVFQREGWKMGKAPTNKDRGWIIVSPENLSSTEESDPSDVIVTLQPDLNVTD